MKPQTAISMTSPLLGFWLCAMGAIAGCERKEEIMQIQTPGAQVEVERSTHTGEVDIEITERG